MTTTSTASELTDLYNRKYRDENWRPLTLHPHGVSTSRYDDAARLLETEPRTARLLELGCGSGQLTFALAERFDGLVGIDLSDVRVTTAQRLVAERYPQYRDKVTFSARDVSQPLPFPDKSFDVVLAIALIEHVVDPFALMDEIARVCRPGGCVVLNTPNICYVKHAKDLLLGRLPMTGIPNRKIDYWREHGWDGGHLHYFSRSSLDDLLRHVGFRAEVWTGDGKLAKIRRWYINFVGSLTVRARRV